ncbi:MAG: 3-ketoacyl-ACP reductase [Phycisphaerae bacterium]|nr:3-ketoacyl-ACP reductase [Phycisphaerae bacterium]
MSGRRVALVTGGSRGIGLGIAQKLASSGFEVAINGRREESDVADAIEAIRACADGRAVHYIRGDIGDAGAREALIADLRSRAGRLDVLVNNAGVAPDVRAGMLEASEESFDRVLSINLKGPYFLTQLAARWMVEQKEADPAFRGVIVNVSSVSATVASPNRGEYCISKAGVAMATSLWAAALAEFGIDVYEVRPGIIETDMTSGVKAKYDALFEAGLTVDRRWGTPADVGRAVSLLASGELRYATGNVLMVDGGLTLQRL